LLQTCVGLSRGLTGAECFGSLHARAEFGKFSLGRDLAWDHAMVIMLSSCVYKQWVAAGNLVFLLPFVSSGNEVCIPSKRNTHK